MPAIAASGPTTGSDESSGRVHWRINDAGQAERSFGNEPWQTVLPEKEFRTSVVSVSGSDVWLGGENLGLYHSRDNGTTWQSVRLPAKNGDTNAILHIRFQGSLTGTVEAADGITWSTVDGGRTWK